MDFSQEALLDLHRHSKASLLIACGERVPSRINGSFDASLALMSAASLPAMLMCDGIQSSLISGLERRMSLMERASGS